jgi:hypothetical protein
MELEELGEPLPRDDLVAPGADPDEVAVDWVDAYEF